jgi:1-acyl-sn-glycerol-3-phosphate acyltransferase
MGSPLRAAVRVAGYLGLTLVLLPVQILAVWLDRPLAVRLPVAYHGWCCRLLGLRVQPRGKRIEKGPVLFVCNHISYIDITVLGSLLPASFVAKSEVATWPLFGLLAKLQRTVFIDRRGSRAAAHRDDMLARLDRGDSLILFPEGTSGDGNRVLPFKSALFSVAQIEGAKGPLTVQPVTIAYTKIDGLPLGRTFRPYLAWYGDMDLLTHFFSWLGLGRITVEVTFHDPVTFAEFGSRKGLSDHCHDIVANGLATSNSGRRLPSPPVSASA